MRSALLLSGGLDSIAIAAWKKPDVAYTVNYGQLPYAGELRSARATCEELGLRHRELTVDVGSLGSGDLAGRNPLNIAPSTEWWPYRNQLLVTIAAMACLQDDVEDLMIGTVAGDAFHGDGRRVFIDSLDRLLSEQEGGLRLSAPAIAMSTVELVRVSGVSASLLRLGHSCHTASVACGTCRGCVKYINTWSELGAKN